MARPNYFATIFLLLCLQYSVPTVSAASCVTCYLTDLCEVNTANLTADSLYYPYSHTILVHREYETFPSNLDCRVTIRPTRAPAYLNYEYGVELEVRPARIQYQANTRSKCEDYRVELFHKNSHSMEEAFLSTTKCLTDGPITFGVASLIHIHFHFNNGTVSQAPSRFRMTFRNAEIPVRTTQPPTKRYTQPSTNRPTRKPITMPTDSGTPLYVYILATVIPMVMVGTIAYGCYKQLKMKTLPPTLELWTTAPVQSYQAPAFPMLTLPVHRQLSNQQYPEDEPPPYPIESPPPFYQHIHPSDPFHQIEKPMYFS